MSIVTSEIREDSTQADGRRHIREVHTDHVGVEHHFLWMADSGQDASAVLAARASALPARLAAREIEANMQEIANG